MGAAATGRACGDDNYNNDVGGKRRCCENRSVDGDDELRIVVMLDRSL